MADSNPPELSQTEPPEAPTPPILPEPAKGSLLWRIGGIIRTLRPHQWLKNAFVLAPVVFAKDIFEVPLLLHALGAFSVFCLLAGAVYTMNDIVDVEGDRAHPVKRFRPIPSGRVPLQAAKVLAVVLIIVSLGAGFWLRPSFGAVASLYLAQNVAYSFGLKKVPYLDVALISAGFVLRVVAGGLATGIEVSSYLFACTGLLALFLGFGKRRHEFAQAERAAEGQGKKQREVLERYRKSHLDWALALTGIATVITYVAYTIDPHTVAFFHNDRLYLTSMLTALGMGRFLQLVRGSPKAESPTQEMLRDVPFILILVFWVIWVMVIVYQLRPAVAP